MFNLQNIIKKFLKTQISYFHRPYCLLSRNKSHECRNCIENCPSTAIKKGEVIEHDEDKCQGCGICAASCPTGAFILEEPTYQDLLVRIGEREKVSVSCQKGEKLPGMIIINCLGYLDTQILLSIALFGTKVSFDFNQERCDKCDCNATDRILEAFKSTKRILKIIGLEDKIGDVGDIKIPNEISLSRQEFLALYRDEIGSVFKKSATYLLNSEFDTDSVEKADKGINRTATRKIELPEKRKLVLMALSKSSLQQEELIIDSSELPFGRLSISNKCIGCGDCTVFCPTGALKKLVKDGKNLLIHKQSYCLKCGLCIIGCCNGAINFMDRINLNDIIENRDIEVFLYEKANCFDCGTEVSSVSNNICHECQMKRELKFELDKIASS